jgi:hypothetical protein
MGGAAMLAVLTDLCRVQTALTTGGLGPAFYHTKYIGILWLTMLAVVWRTLACVPDSNH